MFSFGNKSNMPKKDQSVLSNTIDFLRFPLIIAVVFIHCDPASMVIGGKELVEKNTYPIYSLLRWIVSEEVARIAVPLFFFISGFLFFYRSPSLTISDYVKKLKKRARTLLIPYILWNIFMIILFICAQLFIPSMLSGASKPILDKNFFEWINMFWGYPDEMPICYQFWFIRDLIVTVCLSPIICFFIRRLKFYFIAVVGMLWASGFDFNITGLSSISIFFFSFGAWFSINSRIFTNDFSSFRWAATIYLVLLILNVFIRDYNLKYCNLISNINIVIGLISVVSWVSHGLTHDFIRVNKLLTNSSFFIYAYHTTIISLLLKCYVLFFRSSLNESILIVGYFIIPFIVAFIGVGLYVFLHKYFPSFTALITGGR